jgi:cytoskeletal protein CcmA (bactofilin family)
VPNHTAPPCVLRADAEFVGLVRLIAPARIEGRIDGEVIASGLLWIGSSARVKARVTAPEIVVAGILEGTARASDRIELLSTARVKATLQTPRLVLAEGCFFEGSCQTAPERADSSPNPLHPSP